MNNLIEVLSTAMDMEGGNFGNVFSRVFGELEFNDNFPGDAECLLVQTPSMHPVNLLISQLLEFNPSLRLTGDAEEDEEESAENAESQRYVHMFQKEGAIDTDSSQTKEACQQEVALIEHHIFFEDIDWDLLNKRLVPAPPVPVQAKKMAMKHYGFDVVKSVSNQYGEADDIDIWAMDRVTMSLDDFLRRDGKHTWLDDGPLQFMIKKYIPGGSSDALFEGWMYDCGEEFAKAVPKFPDV